MSSISFQIEKKDFDKIKQHYLNYEIPAPQYAYFAAKANNTRVTLYNSGKILFQGTNAEKEATLWQKNQQLVKKNNQLPPDFATWSVIGSDEVGNGSYFGPLVVCATFVQKEHLQTLTKLGIKDSKLLTDSKMEQLTPILKDMLPHKILIVSPAKYNEIQGSYNAVKMKSVLHNRALALLEQEIAPTKAQGILIDQFTNINNYQKDIQNENPKAKTPIYMITKGEQYHLAVAAASIIARTTFLTALEQEGQTIGYHLPSGAGNNVDIIAAKIIQEKGIQTLNNVAKLHFSNTKKALILSKTI